MHMSIRKAVLAGVAIAFAAIVPVQVAQAQSGMLSLRKPSPVGSYLAGVAALENLDGNRAARYFMDAASEEWDNPVYVSRAFLSYLVAGKISDAATLAHHLLDLEPNDELARLTLGTVALKQRRYSSAEQTLSRISDGSLIGLTGGILRAWAQAGNGNPSAALATLDALGDSGFADFLVFHRALVADVGGLRGQALDYAREAYEMDPFVTRIAEAYVRILANAGRFEEAQIVLDEYAAEGIAHPLVDSLRAPVAAGRRPGLFANSVQSGATEMFHGLGTALARDGSLELGVVFLQLALYLDPEASVVAMTLGELFASAGRYSEADAVYGKIPSSSPLSTSALIRLAESRDAQDDREGAISRLRNIVNSNPDNVEAWGALGDVLRYDERWEEAADAYTQLINTIETDRPRDWRYYYVRGIAYERAGHWENAEPDFKRALELNPDQPQVLNYLGYSWVDMGMNLEPALEMIERAVELRPRDGYIIDSLGWAFFRLGRVDEAIAELERALQYLPNDPEINDHLGDAYWVAGRHREAMFQWRIAIAVDERGEVTERARPKLTEGLVDMPEIQ